MSHAGDDINVLRDKARKANGLLHELYPIAAYMAAIPEGDVHGRGVIGAMRKLGIDPRGENYWMPRDISNSKRDLAEHLKRATELLEFMTGRLDQVLELSFSRKAGHHAS